MPMSMHAASVALYVRLLQNLLTWLDKAEAHALAMGFPSINYLVLRLAPDMLPFAQQVVIACEVARTGAAQLAGVEMQPWTGGADDSLQALSARVKDAIAFLEAVRPEQVAGSATREVILPQRKGDPMHFTGEGFLQRWALPNFFFHVTTTYALLRHAGVDLGKADYLGPV
jgi:hypothetical protein